MTGKATFFKVAMTPAQVHAVGRLYEMAGTTSHWEAVWLPGGPVSVAYTRGDETSLWRVDTDGRSEQI